MANPLTAGRSPWWIVVGAVLSLIVGNGPVMQFTFGVFLQPVAVEFGVDRGTISVALMAGLCITGLSMPFVGGVIDLYGVRRVTIPAVILFGMSVASLGLSPSVVPFIFIYALVGLFAAGQTPLPYARAVSRAFDRQRGLALGIAMAGVGVGTILLPLIAQMLVTAVGWRRAYFALGATVLVVALPAVFFLIHERDEAPSQAGSATGTAVGTALRGALFWTLAAAFFLVTLSAAGVVAHVVPLLGDRGVPPERAAIAISVAGAAMIAGRLISGYMLDRIHAPRVALIFFALQGGGIALLLLAPSAPTALLAAFFVGLGLGAEVDLIAYMLSRYFGMRSFGVLYGVLFGVFMFAGGLGPFVMGAVHQSSGRYDTALTLFCAAMAAACLLMFRLDRGTDRLMSQPRVPVGAA